MRALIEGLVEVPGASPCRVTVERAPRHDLRLADLLVEIDLQSYTEATFSRYTAAALLEAGETYLLRADEQIVGACVVVRRWDPPDEAHLLSVGIRAGWRGRGLGQQFVAWVLDALREDGIRGATLLVSDDNVAAVRIYRELGFDDVDVLSVDPVTGDRQLRLRARLVDADRAAS